MFILSDLAVNGMEGLKFQTSQGTMGATKARPMLDMRTDKSDKMRGTPQRRSSWLIRVHGASSRGRGCTQKTENWVFYGLKMSS